jgi:hypothetical protein
MIFDIPIMVNIPMYQYPVLIYHTFLMVNIHQLDLIFGFKSLSAGKIAIYHQISGVHPGLQCVVLKCGYHMLTVDPYQTLAHFEKWGTRKSAAQNSETSGGIIPAWHGCSPVPI